MTTEARQAQAAIRRQRRLLLLGMLLMFTGFAWSILLQST